MTWQSNPDVLERVARCNEIYNNLLTINRAFLSRLLDVLTEVHDLIGNADEFRALTDAHMGWLAGRDVVSMVALWRRAREDRTLQELARLQPDATISLFAGVPVDTDTDRLVALLQMPPGERRRALDGQASGADSQTQAADEARDSEPSEPADGRRYVKMSNIKNLTHYITSLTAHLSNMEQPLREEIEANRGDHFYRRRCDNVLAQLDACMAKIDSVCALLLDDEAQRD